MTLCSPLAPRAARAVTRLVVQLSDTHIRRPGELAEGRVDTAARTGARRRGRERAAATRRRGHRHRRPRRLGQAGAVRAPAGAARAARRPGLPAARQPRRPRRHARRVHRARLPARHAPRLSCTTRSISATLRLVVLDTSVAGVTHGEIDAAQLADLDATLVGAARAGDDRRHAPSALSHLDRAHGRLRPAARRPGPGRRAGAPSAGRPHRLRPPAPQHRRALRRQDR